MPRLTHVNAALIGVPGGRHLLDTPALLIDLPAMARNIERMAAFAKSRGVALRPHVKTHKSIEIARRQVAAGAVGVSCVTLGEAEVMVDGGIRGVLITSPLVTPSKIARLVKLADRAVPGGVMVVVDDARNAEELAKAATAAGLLHPLHVLVDFGAGYNRTGVSTEAQVLELAARIAAEPRLRLRGLQAYAGNLQHIAERAERASAAAGLRETVAGIVAAAARKGIKFEIVTGAGTGTHDLDAEPGAFTELQAGSYVFMDAEYSAVLGSGAEPRPSRSRCSCRPPWSARRRPAGSRWTAAANASPPTAACPAWRAAPTRPAPMPSSATSTASWCPPARGPTWARASNSSRRTAIRQ